MPPRRRSKDYEDIIVLIFRDLRYPLAVSFSSGQEAMTLIGRQHGRPAVGPDVDRIVVDSNMVG